MKRRRNAKLMNWGMMQQTDYLLMTGDCSDRTVSLSDVKDPAGMK